MRVRDTSIFHALIFFSGVSALVYELLWMRQFHLIFGVSSFAVAAVLTAYMLGLAIGSVLFGKLSERVRDLAAVYGLIEIGIGLTAFGSLLAIRNIHLVERFYYEVYAQQGLYALSLVRLVLCLAALLLPTVLIGGTIPVVTKCLVSSDRNLGREFGTIYYANALGGFVGVVLAWFLLVRWLGITASYLLAVFVNIAIGLVALRLRGRSQSPVCAAARPAVPSMLLVVFLTGFVVFGYELVWLRLLSIYGRATTYSLSAVLAGFLAGIALGSLLFSLCAERLASPFRRLARWALSSAALGVIALVCFRGMRSMLGGAGGNLTTFTELFLGFSLSLAVAVPFGVLFPLALRIFTGSSAQIGSWTGSVYFMNTLGAICGSLITGFMLIPLLGLQNSVVFFVAIQLFVAIHGSFLERGGPHRARMFLAIGLVGLSAAAVAVFGDGRHYRLTGSQDRLVWYEEGLSGTVTVTEYPALGRTYRDLLVDSEPVASTFPADVVDAKLLAHVPLLVARKPRTALSVGFGSGGTSRSMHLHGVEVTVVEIEEAVVRANHLFQESSRGVLREPGLRLVIDDARSFLLATRESFDVIVTDVTNLKYKGNPSLYTRDSFALMRGKLAPGGVAAAWVPLGGESYRDLRILIAGFHAVFPHTTVWFYSLETTHFLVLVGTENRLSLSLDEVNPPPRVKADLAEMGIRGAAEFASMLFMGEVDVARVARGVPLHTDEHPVLEFSDMAYYLVPNSHDNLERLFQQQTEDLSTYLAGSAETIRAAKAGLQSAAMKHRESIRRDK